MNYKYVIVSVHDVCPVFEAETLEWLAWLDEWGIARRSLAVVPFFSGASLSASLRLVSALRSEIDAGAEIVLHGNQHRFTGTHVSRLNRAWSRLATRGCEEFAALPADKAEELIRAGLRELTAALPGARIEGFTPPGWWMSKGTIEAAARLNLRFVTNLHGVHNISVGKFVRVPVLSGLPLEAGFFGKLAEAWNRVRLAAPRGNVIRIALHPYDLRNRRFVAWIKKTFRAMQARNVKFLIYSELMALD